MIVDIEVARPDVAWSVSMSGMVTNVCLKVAGDKLDEAIINLVRRHHNMMIVSGTAEQIKIRLGSVWPPPPDQEEPIMDMKGRGSDHRVPCSIELTSGDVREALVDCARSILDAVKATLEKTPPELLAIFQNGGWSWPVVVQNSVDSMR